MSLRIGWIDNAKAIGIVAIIVGHDPAFSQATGRSAVRYRDAQVVKHGLGAPHLWTLA